MADVTKKCRVCGKDYIACRSPNPTGMFRWRDVACSTVCAAEYLQRINDSRSGVTSAHNASNLNNEELTGSEFGEDNYDVDEYTEMFGDN